MSNHKHEKGFELFQVGWHKGEIDFSVSAIFTELTYEEMKEWREMVVVAIAQAENMFSRGQEEKQQANLSELPHADQ